MTTSQFKRHFHCNKFIVMNSLTLTFSETQKALSSKTMNLSTKSNEFFYLISKYFIVFGK